MSSLMQHHGTMDRKRGVELLLYLRHEVPTYPRDESNVWEEYGTYGLRCDISTKMADSEPQHLEWNGSFHIVPKLYRIWRKPVDMFGCWVRFRINGKLTAPDLSTPIDMVKLPRDAEPLTDAEAIHYWSH